MFSGVKLSVGFLGTLSEIPVKLPLLSLNLALQNILVIIQTYANDLPYKDIPKNDFVQRPEHYEKKLSPVSMHHFYIPLLGHKAGHVHQSRDIVSYRQRVQKYEAVDEVIEVQIGEIPFQSDGLENAYLLISPPVLSR